MRNYMENKQEVRGKNSQVTKLNHIIQRTVAAVILGAVLLILTVGANIKLSLVANEQLLATKYTNQYRLGSKALTYAVQAYAVTGEQKYYDDYIRELEKDKNRDIAWEGLEKINIKENEWSYLKQIVELSNGLVPLELDAIESVISGNQEVAISDVFGTKYEDTIQKINELSDQVVEEIQNRMKHQMDRIKIQQVVFEVLLVTAFMIIVLQIFITIRFSRKELLYPIISVEKQMIELAKGNLHIEFNMKEDDSEVGKMVVAIILMKKKLIAIIDEIGIILEKMGKGNFNIYIENEYDGDFVHIKDSLMKIHSEMKETLLTIRESSQEINQGAEQLANAATDLAEGSSNQANNVEELVSLVQNMSENMKKNADEAIISVDLAANAKDVLLVGNEKMHGLKEAIGEINKCSEQISTIIGTIEDIATQTNLLSLNAAIEAARAGEAGRGFAVVAEQVKNLATESASAARKTTELIETTINAVNKGMGIANETSDNMDYVMLSAQEATSKMAEMAELLKKDVKNIDQVNAIISHVSAVVDNNSATSQETAAVSEEQKAQVEMMVQMMERFKI